MEKALTTRDVSDLTHVPISTLNSWVKGNHCRPSLLGPAGQRVTRYWHGRDVVVVQAIRTLRNAGCPMQLLKKVKKLVANEWELASANHSLVYDGNDLLILDSSDSRLISGGRSPGQGLFPLTVHVATIPISSWIQVARGLGEDVDLSLERKRRRERNKKRAEARRTVSFAS